MKNENPREPVSTSSPPYREGTKIAPTKLSLVFNAGGIGDYIHWTNPMRYALDSNPHIHGHIFSPPYFLDLARLWFKDYYPRFTVKSYEGTADLKKEDHALVIPTAQQLANACGFHLTHLGFIYFTQKDKIIPEYSLLPEIKGDECDLRPFSLPEKFAVILTEATAANRRLPAETVNKLTAHTLSLGLTPVFLGKKELAVDYTSESANGLDLTGVLDLREKTSLIEAACIMAKASFTLGIDGGLLHLASCSSAPVIFIFTTVHPQYRIPSRRILNRTYVITPPESLSCRFCNTGDPEGPAMTYLVGHDFKKCLYEDDLCTKIISPETIITAINRAVREVK